MKTKISFCILLLLCFSLSAMQKSEDPLKLSNKPSLVTKTPKEESIKKTEDTNDTQKRYFDYLYSYAANCYVSLEALIWTANNHGWPYVISRIDDLDAEIKYKKLDFDPGFRGGFGIKTAFDWDMLFQFTFFNHDVSQSTSCDRGCIAPYVPAPFLYSKTKWSVKYRMIDLELGRSISIRKTFSFKSHIGIRGGWIKQRGTTKYDGRIPPGPIPDPRDVPATAQYSEKEWVVGPRAGVDTALFFGSTGLNFYGNLAGALLYGDSDNWGEVWDTDSATLLLEKRGRFSSKIQDLKANLQVAFGLAWGDFITKDNNIALTLRLGWEGNYWWNQFQENVTWRIGDDNTFGYLHNQPLIIQGGVINIRFDF